MVMEETKAMTRSVVKSSPLECHAHYMTRAALEESSCLLPSPKSKKNVVFTKGLNITGKSTGINPRRKKGQEDLTTSFASDEGVSDLSFHQNLPDIPPILMRPRHPLKQAWTLWYYRNDRALSWEANQLEVATVTTIEEFWQLYQLLQPASNLPQGTDYAMFRSGVLPDWEDPANTLGGRWVARRENQCLDAAWLELLFYLIGEHADKMANQVNGVVVSVRKKGSKVAVWLRDARHMVAVVDVGRQVRARLGLRPEVKMKFSVHKEERERVEGGAVEKLADILL